MNVTRMFDFSVALIILIISAPVLAAVALLIAITQGLPVFFSQKRLGKNNEEFKLLKFCTMTDKRDKHGQLLPDEERVTRLGAILRSTSIDELPGFWNVMVGNMSIVGPRPLPVHYRERYSEEQAKRHQVKPGVTGWAQINGRNAISWEKKFALDVWYVNNRSFLLDLRIFVMTFGYVFSKHGIVPDNKGSMDEFMGNDTGDGQ